MKKTLSILLSLVMLLSITAGLDLSAYADEPLTSGDYKYELLDDSTVQITEYTGLGGDITIPPEIDSYTVTSIGNYAFSECTGLTSVTIPNSVIGIGVKAFEYCTSLISVKFPNSLKSLGDRAFQYTGLNNVMIPESVTDIGSYPFYECTELSDIEVNINNNYYSSNDGVLFDKDKTQLLQYPCHNTRETYTIPDSVTEIDSFAFNKSKNLKNIKFSENVKKIYGYAFQGCTGLISVEIPNGITEMPIGAFAYCTNLVNVSLPDSITKISNIVFAYCTNLKSIEISKNVSLICIVDAFKACTALTSINVSSENSYYSSLNGVLFNKNKTELLQYPKGIISTNYTIPNGVKRLYATAFISCKELKSITIPKSVTTIDSDVFSECTNLNDVYYNGTSAEWNKISIDNYANFNDCLLNANIHYQSCKNHTYKTTTSKATTNKNGSVVTKCTECGTVKSSTVIAYPKTITLSGTSYTYDGKAKKPSVTVKDSNGKKIASSNYTVTYSSDRKNVGKYNVTIKFKGNYSGTVTKTFTIKPKSTSVSKLSAKKKGFTVKWKKQATQTTGYEIQYATDSKFTKNKKTVTVSKNKTTSKTISKLKAKKKYYVRVRTYKTVKVNGKSTKIYSLWSKAKSVTTKK